MKLPKRLDITVTDLAARAVALKADHPDWGYLKIAKVIGGDADRHKVRRAIEHAERKPMVPALAAVGGSALELYGAACRALGEAKDVVALKDVADRASALKEYARLANDRVLELNAAELRILSERKLGQMLLAAKEAGQLSRGQPPKNSQDSGEFFSRVKLADAGIDHNLSARAQKLALFDDSAFGERLSSWRDTAEHDASRITVDLLRDGDKRERRAAREADLGERQAAGNLGLPDKRYGVILADPEWRFEPWSRETGLDRSADNHYPTSVTEVIAARPVQDIAAKDCILFLWATVPMLPHALTVMAAWGFDYRSHIVWSKRRDNPGGGGLFPTITAVGTGYWFRNVHELLLIGVRGAVPAPAPGDQWHSLIEAVVGKHSVKPECFQAMIEWYFPSLPKIELNARQAREGWDSWGAEAPRAEGLAEVANG